ncbi:TetR/AcrR family transcriptional regulator [Streptomyces sp. SID12501]|uniref:TetR family transcriptional regulator n=1 Tax=Streptomyces sp. SID12501 TaxID=2706042 RepID=A0A6B3BY63_9ACTN|nr:TetR family transcriptional regulator [Streptomyces sp. SID12501]NEC89298.1 TetR family transcriptional regulator [Streptomyces sp. SID12501]
MTLEMGLRERKKLATRAALSHAAWSLMIERGLEAATPEAIAEAADVSPRTFRNYFAGREEAILDGLVSRAASVTDALRARPVGEPLWDSLAQALPSFVTAFIGRRDDIVVLMRAVEDDPAMRAQHLVTFEHVHQQLTELVAERTGTDAEHDMAPRLMAAVASAALRTSVEMWATGDDDVSLPDLIRESLTQLRAGLPIGAVAPAL